MSYGRRRANFERQTTPPSDPRKWGAKCDLCPLKGSSVVFGDGNVDADIAFVGEAPGQEEARVGVPFIGRSGESLENFIAQCGLKRTEVWVDNAIACFPPGGNLDDFLTIAKKAAKADKREFHSPVDCCRPRLFWALGIPQCSKCGRWCRGPDALVCTCPKPSPVFPAGTARVSVAQPLGNAALQSLTGLTGIMERRGYRENMEERRERAVKSAPKKGTS